MLNWQGVFPAITTPFLPDGSVDHEFLAHHVNWLMEAGCHGIVPCGSLGEGATLTPQEKRDVIRTCISAVGGRGPVIPGIAALSTAEAADLARDAEALGCGGLMVLPPYAYSTDWPEMKAHVVTVSRATGLPILLYNNPVAYKTDFLPEHIVELANELPNVEAVKESSTDVRRVTAIRALAGDRLKLLVGVDDAIVEGIRAGAIGWIAGLVNAFPKESLDIWQLTLDGKHDEAEALYRWFLPLLRLDTVPKFVQLIKLTQQHVDMGHERVRPPRQILTGTERAEADAIITHALRTRPV